MSEKPNDTTDIPDHGLGKKYSFINHRSCESFPCHSGIHEDSFNCLFCYCPLYMMGSNCGGTFQYLKNGVKDCSACGIPHGKDNYRLIIDRFNTITAMNTDR